MYNVHCMYPFITNYTLLYRILHYTIYLEMLCWKLNCFCLFPAFWYRRIFHISLFFHFRVTWTFYNLQLSVKENFIIEFWRFRKKNILRIYPCCVSPKKYIGILDINNLKVLNSLIKQKVNFLTFAEKSESDKSFFLHSKIYGNIMHKVRFLDCMAQGSKII